MKLTIKDNCPLDNFKPCKKFECAWFGQFRGMNPQTGQEADEYGCVVAFLPLLLMEVARSSNGTGAAVESFRNDMVKINVAALNSGFQNLGPRLTSTRPDRPCLDAPERDPHTPDLFIEAKPQ